MASMGAGSHLYPWCLQPSPLMISMGRPQASHTEYHSQYNDYGRHPVFCSSSTNRHIRTLVRLCTRHGPCLQGCPVTPPPVEDHCCLDHHLCSSPAHSHYGLVFSEVPTKYVLTCLIIDSTQYHTRYFTHSSDLET